MIPFEMVARRSPHQHVNDVQLTVEAACKELNFTHYFTWSSALIFNLHVHIQGRLYHVQCKCEELGGPGLLGHWHIISDACRLSMSAADIQSIAARIIEPIIILECKRAWTMIEERHAP
jgi:hypothetical protein